MADITIVLFGHRNWRESVEFMAHRSTKWEVFLMSLKELIEAGRGENLLREMSKSITGINANELYLW